MSYEEMYQRSVEDPEGFWAEQGEKIHWDKKWDSVLDSSKPPFYKWFPGGELNTCYNAVDLHVEDGRGDQPAIIYDSPVTDTIQHITYNQLKGRVSKIAGALKSMGVEKGDTVIVYMPMIPEAAMAMLACARIGAVHSVVFGGFAPRELAIRIDDAKPKVILSASCGIEGKKVIAYKPLLDKAIDLADHKVEKCMVLQRPQAEAVPVDGRDLDWTELEAASEPADCVSVGANDPLYILYTSGTTGKPKGVVRDNGGHAVALKWTMGMLYGVNPGDVYWAASDVGWVVGHSYIVYGPLFLGATTIMYEGKPIGTPDPGAFWRVISEHNVKVLFTAPTAFRAIKKEDPDGEYLKKYDISNFEALYLAGERTDPDTYEWATELLGRPVIDHWWQTETGWAIVGNPRGVELFPIKPGSATKPMPGWDVCVLDPLTGDTLPDGQNGVIAVKLPLPPGTFPTLWHNEQGYTETYMDPFPGYYFTGDGGIKDEDGYIHVMGRVDDIINVAGHRLSTGEMEEIVAKHPCVAECAVLGAADDLKGEVPIGFIVLKAGVDKAHDEIVSEVVQSVRNDIGPIACFKQAIVVNRLPKTRSGKMLRGTMRKIADAQDYNMPSTIDDPDTLGEIEEAVKKIGYGKK
ncbi:MAG: propionyl-CoA synthetase [Phycisphaerales bacterium]|jgi:propionyl-CoA synthetase|nr:propionyl-CoA synthetase [Phycisphaerales bacterium]